MCLAHGRYRAAITATCMLTRCMSTTCMHAKRSTPLVRTCACVARMHYTPDLALQWTDSPLLRSSGHPPKPQVMDKETETRGAVDTAMNKDIPMQDTKSEGAQRHPEDTKGEPGDTKTDPLLQKRCRAGQFRRNCRRVLTELPN